MKLYYIDFPDDELITPVTWKLNEFLVENSECFSFTYYHNKEEPATRQCKLIRQSLKPLLIFGCRQNKWPGNEVYNLNPTAYYTVEYYNIQERFIPNAKDLAEKALLTVDSLYEWDHPNRPMDLCMYRDGICWFYVVAHEKLIVLYTDSYHDVEAIMNMGNVVRERFGLPQEMAVPGPSVKFILDDTEGKYKYMLPDNVNRRIKP